MWSIISYWLFSEMNYRCMSTRSPLARRVSRQCRERGIGDSAIAGSDMQTVRNHPAGLTEKIQSNLRRYNSIRMHLVQGVAHWTPSKFTPLYVNPNETRSRKPRLTAVKQFEIVDSMIQKAS